VTDPDLQVRRAVCEAHGLPWTASKFLDGDTVKELEASATRLADVLGKRQEEAGPTDIIATARAATAQRKHELNLLFSGRTPAQPRDEEGRFATRPASDFSGGARTPPPRRQTHERWLADALRDGRADVGRHL